MIKTPKNYKQVHSLEDTRKLVEQDHHRWYDALGKPTGKRRRPRRTSLSCDKCGGQPEFLHAEGDQRLCGDCL